MSAQQDEFRTRVLVRSEESRGRVGIVENTVPARWEGPPLHHHDFDEAFYVLEGQLGLAVGDELVTAAAGALAFARRGVDHTLANLTDEPAHYLLICTPGGFERYFAKLAGEEGPTGPYPETVVVGPPLTSNVGARAIEPGSGRVNVLLTGATSSGHTAVMDNHVPAGAGGPPLHHHAFDEAFYVVEGRLDFQVGNERTTVESGEMVFAPGGAHHAFANPHPTDARMLLVCTPAGFERYFQRIAAREAGVEPPPEALEPWPEVTKVGPPIGT
jgi:mannose-6-phosphate isomerase-like protein (cupin superfamily)